MVSADSSLLDVASKDSNDGTAQQQKDGFVLHSMLLEVARHAIRSFVLGLDRADEVENYS
jgi:hypothetical protein